MPLSPEAARKVTPVETKWLSRLRSVESSADVQLIETTDAPLRTAKSTPASKSLRLFEGASTRRILACGAMACAHSISSEISTAQFAFAAGLRPLEYSWRKQPLLVVQAGRLNCWLKTLRSFPALASS